MNKETFIDLLDNKELLKNTSSADLFNIVNEFPYCQTSRILLTMSLYNEGHFKYDAELKTTALYVGDRRKLKHHIDSLSITEPELEHPDAIEEITEQAKEPPADTIEEQIFIQNKEILGTGSDGGAGSDVSKGS